MNPMTTPCFGPNEYANSLHLNSLVGWNSSIPTGTKPWQRHVLVERHRCSPLPFGCLTKGATSTMVKVTTGERSTPLRSIQVFECTGTVARHEVRWQDDLVLATLRGLQGNAPWGIRPVEKAT